MVGSTRLTAAPKPFTPLLWAALAAVYVIWGSTYLAIRVAVETLPPLLLAGARFLLAGTLLLPFALRTHTRTEEPDPIGIRQWGAAALVGTLLLFGGNGLVTVAEQTVPSGLAALFIAGVPLWMAVVAALARFERATVATFVGVGLGMAGIATLVDAGAAWGAGGPDPLGVGLLILSPMLWSVGSVMSPRLPLPRRPLVATALEMLAGGTVLTLAALVKGELAGFSLSDVSAASMLAWLYLVVFGSLIAFSAYVYLLGNAAPSIVSTYAYVNPVIAVFLGWLLLDEVITTRTLIGSAIVVAAVALIVRARTRAVIAGRATPEPVGVPEPVPAERVTTP